MRAKKVVVEKAELQRICLDALQQSGVFSDISAVDVAPLLGNRRGNWTIRRITQGDVVKRPSNATWIGFGQPTVERLRTEWELLVTSSPPS